MQGCCLQVHGLSLIVSNAKSRLHYCYSHKNHENIIALVNREPRAMSRLVEGLWKFFQQVGLCSLRIGPAVYGDPQLHGSDKPVLCCRVFMSCLPRCPKP